MATMQLKPLLLHLNNILLKHSHIPPEHQVAWAIAMQHLTAVDCCFQLSTALALTVAVGQCTQLNAIVEQQLLNLIHSHPIIDVLLEALDYTLVASQHDTTAALVRAIHSLALLSGPLGQHKTNLASALCGVFQSPHHRQRLLQAACSSPTGAEAVATLAVTAASFGLPATTLLQVLLLLVPGQDRQLVTAAAAGAGSSGSSSSSSPATTKAWVAVGLRPLLLQVQRQLQLQQQPADADAHAGSKDNTSTDYQRQHQHTLWSTSGFQQLWLLVCTALQVADGQLLDSATLDTVGSFLADPAVQQVLKMALLVSVEQGTVSTALAATLTSHSDSAAAVAPLPQGSGSGSSSSSSSTRHCTHPSHGATLRLPTLQLLRQAAAHSASLAQRCFDSLAPVLPDVLQACQPCPYCLAAAIQEDCCLSGCGGLKDDTHTALETARVESAEARAAVLQLWQQLLLKGCSSYPSRLHSLLEAWLPVAAKALTAAAAAAATDMACDLMPSTACQQGKQVGQHLAWQERNRAEAIAAAFVPLAWQLQAPSKPIICLGGPAAMVQMLTPHAPALVQLVVAGASKLGEGGKGSAAAAAAVAGLPGGDGQAVDAWVLLLAMWLLQSWAATLQQGSIPAPVRAASGSTSYSTMSTSSGTISTGATQLPQVGLKDCCAESQLSTASKLAAVVPQLVSAVAELVATVGNSGAGSDSVQVRCQAKGLDLARALLALQPACGQLSSHSPSSSHSSSSSNSNSNSSSGTISSGAEHAPDPSAAACCGSGSGGSSSSSSSDEPATEATAGCLQQLLSALAGLVSRHPRDPMSLAHRQLLQTACLLLSDLVGKTLAPTAITAVAAQAQGTTNTAEDGAASLARVGWGLGTQQQQQKQKQVWQGLYRDLGVLYKDLMSRKLVRSSSRQELLQAVVDVVGLLGMFSLGG